MYTRRLDMIGANIDWSKMITWSLWREPMYTQGGIFSEAILKSRSKMITWSLWREPQAPGHLCVWLGLAWSCGIHKVSQNWPSKMWSGIVHHKSDRKSCVIPTATSTINKYGFRKWLSAADHTQKVPALSFLGLQMETLCIKLLPLLHLAKENN